MISVSCLHKSCRETPGVGLFRSPSESLALSPRKLIFPFINNYRLLEAPMINKRQNHSAKLHGVDEMASTAALLCASNSQVHQDVNQHSPILLPRGKRTVNMGSVMCCHLCKQHLETPKTLRKAQYLYSNRYISETFIFFIW